MFPSRCRVICVCARDGLMLLGAGVNLAVNAELHYVIGNPARLLYRCYCCSLFFWINWKCKRPSMLLFKIVLHQSYQRLWSHPTCWRYTNKIIIIIIIIWHKLTSWSGCVGKVSAISQPTSHSSGVGKMSSNPSSMMGYEGKQTH